MLSTARYKDNSWCDLITVNSEELDCINNKIYHFLFCTKCTKLDSNRLSPRETRIALLAAEAYRNNQPPSPDKCISWIDAQCRSLKANLSLIESSVDTTEDDLKCLKLQLINQIYLQIKLNIRHILTTSFKYSGLSTANAQANAALIYDQVIVPYYDFLCDTDANFRARSNTLIGDLGIMIPLYVRQSRRRKEAPLVI